MCVCMYWECCCRGVAGVASVAGVAGIVESDVSMYVCVRECVYVCMCV